LITKQLKTTLLVASLVLTSQANALDLDFSKASKGNMYGGFQSSWPSHGFSLKMDLNEKMTAQAVVGFLGTVNNYALRGIYKFKKEQFYDMYGFGSLGILTWSNDIYDENVFGFGGGAGAEYDIRGIDSSFIPLYVSAELGLNIASFDHYNFSSLGLGVGVHYKF